MTDSAKEPEVFMTQKSLTRVFCQLIFIIENGNTALSFERLNYIQLNPL